MKLTVMDRILDTSGRRSKGHKAVAAFLEAHTDKAVFMNAAQIAEAVGVSESTVVRFATAIGYDGFIEFHNALKGYVHAHMNEYAKAHEEDVVVCESALVQEVLEADAYSIRETMTKLSESSFQVAVDAILQARNVYIIGLRNSEPLARFLYFYLQMIRENVHIVCSTNSTEIFEQMIRIGKEDVAIGISFPGYSMRTIKALEFANDRRATVIGITDNEHSPLKMYSSCNLYAPCARVGILDSMVAPLSLMNALILAISRQVPDAVCEHLRVLEQTWANYQVYQNDEINSGAQLPDEEE